MVANVAKGERGRRALDRRGARLRELVDAGARPNGGWVRAIREALGMTTADLAARLDVAQSTVHRLELSEQSGRIQLDTLARAADALGCDLVYALVPRRSLDEIIDDRVRELAFKELAGVGHTMDLEAQGLGAERMQERLQDLTKELKSRPGLWQTTGVE